VLLGGVKKPGSNRGLGFLKLAQDRARIFPSAASAKMSGNGYKTTEADELFKRLDLDLLENIDSQFFSEARDFR
jgi:hypothetical protein